MNNQTINGKQMKYVIALFLIGSILLISEASAEAKQDAWLAITIAAGAAMLLTLIHDAILRLYPGENLYQILINIFGGIFGKILCGIYVFYAIHLGMNVTNSYTGFINIINLDATPKYVIGWFAIIPCIYMVKSGLGVLGRTAKVCFTIMIFLFFIIILASIKIMDFSNIQPMFTTEPKKLLSACYTVFTLPFGEVFLIPTITSINPKENYRKIYVYGIFLGFMVIVLSNLRNIFVLGMANLKLFQYATYMATSIISFGEFFTRIEVITGINLMIAGFFKIVVCCFSAAIGLAKIFNFSEYKYLAFASPLLFITVINFLFKTPDEPVLYIQMYKYTVIPYQLILPVVILIAGLIKKRFAKKSNPQLLTPE